MDNAKTFANLFSGSSAVHVKNESLRKYMLGVYNYMTTGLMCTALVSYFFAKTGLVYLLAKSPLGFVFTFLPLAISFFLQFKVNTLEVRTAKLLFFAYAASIGISLSSIFIYFNIMDIAKSFFITASLFSFMSIYGYTTKKDLTSYSSFFTMAVFGILIASLVNLFTKSSAFSFLISFASVGVFTGLVAYDTQMIKAFHSQIYSRELNKEATIKFAVLAALNLYIDFIAIFMNLLKLIARERRAD